MTNKIVTKAISMLTTPAIIKNENLIMLPGNEKWIQLPYGGALLKYTWLNI